jgi:hypothetical protein
MNEWKNTCKDAPLYFLKALYWHLPRDTMKTSSEDSLSSAQDSNGDFPNTKQGCYLL